MTTPQTCHVCDSPVTAGDDGFLYCPTCGPVWQPHNGYHVRIGPWTPEAIERLRRLSSALLMLGEPV